MVEKFAVKRWIWLMTLLLAAVLWIWNVQPQEALAADGSESKRIPVKVVRVDKKDLSSKLSAMGTINYLAKAEVSSETEGILAEVKVEEGDVVQKGEIIARIDSSLLEAQLERVKTDIEAAEIDLAKTENDSRKAASRLEAARVGMEKTLAIFERYKKLASLGIATETEMDRAAIAYEKSVADYQIALEDSKALQAKSKQGRVEAQVKLQKARADFEMIRLRLAKCTIRAPIAGIVAGKKKWAGENVEPRDSVIVTLLQTQEVFAEVDVNEKSVASLRTGQEAAVMADAYSDRVLRGEVQMISPVIDFNSRTVKVKIKVANDQGLLKVGMFVRVQISLETLKDAVAVPEGAIMSSAEGRQKVFVVLEEVAFLRDVQTGVKRDGWVVVKKGVKAGEYVVVEGQERIRDMAPVQATEIQRP